MGRWILIWYLPSHPIQTFNEAQVTMKLSLLGKGHEVHLCKLASLHIQIKLFQPNHFFSFQRAAWKLHWDESIWWLVLASNFTTIISGFKFEWTFCGKQDIAWFKPADWKMISLVWKNHWLNRLNWQQIQLEQFDYVLMVTLLHSEFSFWMQFQQMHHHMSDMSNMTLSLAATNLDHHGE
jgi:hypothetical protein